MIDWILSTSLHHWVLDTYWAWPLFETLHFIGLCLLLGALLVVDLRMLGLFRSVSIQSVHQLIPVMLTGFMINLTTGLLFFIGDPERYSINIGFQIKMILVILAGLNAIWFALRLSRPMQQWPSSGDTPFEAKLVGGLSLILWFSVLICGRLIPYVGTG